MEGRDDRPMEGGGHPVDGTGRERDKVKEAGSKVSVTKGFNLAIWLFLALLIAVIVIAVVGGLLD